MGTLIRVDGPGIAAGIVLDEQDHCVQAAPILGWTLGMSREDLREEFRLRGLRASVIGAGDRLPPALSVGRPEQALRRRGAAVKARLTELQ